MRHLASIVLSIVLAPVIYVLTGIGLVKVLTAFEPGNAHLTAASGLGLLALLAAGALYAVLAQARLSPLGPFLAGLAFLGIGLWAVITPSSTAKLPQSVFGIAEVAQQPLLGMTVLLAVPLMLTILSPYRWRRYAQPRPAAPAYPFNYAPPPPYPSPGPASAPPAPAPEPAPAPASPAPTFGPSSPFPAPPPFPAPAAFSTPTSAPPAWPTGPSTGVESDHPTQRMSGPDDPEQTRRL